MRSTRIFTTLPARNEQITQPIKFLKNPFLLCVSGKNRRTLIKFDEKNKSIVVMNFLSYLSFYKVESINDGQASIKTVDSF